MNSLNILKSLNIEQRAVVKSINGSYFVLSGPGSGKTKCLVSRTQYMIQNHISPESILLFTFTIKAANEIKERIKSSINNEIADKISIGTYHSICLKILKQYYKAIGILKENFTIYDQTDSTSIIKRICGNSSFDSKSISSYISNMKDHLISYDEAINSASNNVEKTKAEIYSAYQKILIKNNAIDFDDIIYYTVKILENNSTIRSLLTDRYKYIISDETQDASTSNIRLLELLGENNNICMFLDDDQSIYGFRGADIREVLNSTKTFTNMQTLYLNKNYRSTQTIVNASLGLINHNIERKEKSLYTDNIKGDKICYFTKYTKDQEASTVKDTIKYLHNKKNIPYKEIAVLYRNNALSRNVEQALIKNEIPYIMKNNISFYERKEIKDIIAYIKFIINHYDDEAFKRIINIPKRGIGTATIAKIENYVDKHSGDDILMCIKAMINDIGVFSKAVKSKMQEFADTISTLTNEVDENTPSDFIVKVLNRIDYINVLKNECKENWCEKYTNILEMISVATQFIDIKDFIGSFMLDAEQNNSNDDKVTLSTIHGCKGLEWQAVIIIGLNDNILPGRSSVEEERRLFYVAMTRAKEYLFLSRFVFDHNSEASQECRFIKEISKDYITG